MRAELPMTFNSLLLEVKDNIISRYSGRFFENNIGNLFIFSRVP